MEGKRTIFAIDLKSFYASVECVRRGLDPFKTPLVVADLARGDSTIVLAASPYIRSAYHVPSRCRLREVDRSIPGLVVARPHMRDYLEKSAEVNAIYLDYVAREDLYPYSVDESFLDVTAYLRNAKMTPEGYARQIIADIKGKTGLTVTCGIGENLFMAKACMDIEAKRRPDYLARWTKEDIPARLWPVKPLSRMWGIGSRLQARLERMGFATVGDIAVSDPRYLKGRLGVVGEEIYAHANGEDDARIQEPYEAREHSYSVGEVLLRDYARDEIPTVINDLSIELATRLHKEEKASLSFLLSVGRKDQTGFTLPLRLETPTDSARALSGHLVRLFLGRGEREGTLYRQVHIVAADVRDRESYQMSLFEDLGEKERQWRMEETAIGIRERFGALKAMPCSALTRASTFVQRSQQIGGHHR